MGALHAVPRNDSRSLIDVCHVFQDTHKHLTTHSSI